MRSPFRTITLALAAAATVAGASAATAQPGPAQPGPGRTGTAQTVAARTGSVTTLAAGASVRSPNGQHTLVMQHDGNLVLYSAGRATWSSWTFVPGSRFIAQGDGNLVVYARDGRAVWHAGTYANPGARLVLQDDGNLVLYAGNRPLWWTLRAFVSSITPVTAADLGTSYRAGCPVPPGNLRAVSVTYNDFNGQIRQGRIIVHQDVAEQTRRGFAALFQQRFPLASVRPVSDFGASDEASMAANNSSGFNCRRVAGSTRWSEHAYGRAIDLNPVQNPYVSGTQVSPPAGRGYAWNRSPRPGVLAAGGTAVHAFAGQGFIWGGTWSSAKDYQHFSTTGR